MPDKIDQLYDALKADGAVTKSRENFRAYMQDEQNRRQLYDALKADGAVTSGSFEDFDGRLGVRSVGRTSHGASNYGGGSFGTSGAGTSFGDNDTQRGTKKAYRQVQRPAQQATQQPRQQVQPVRQQPSGRSIYTDIDPEETRRLAAAARTDAVKKEAYKRYRNLAFSNMGNNKFNEYDVAKAFNRMWSDPSRVSDKVLEAVWPEMAKAEKKRKADLDNLFNYNYGGMVAEAQGVDKKSVSNEQLMKAGAAYRDAERRVKDEEEAERYKRFLEYFKYSDMPSARKSYEDFKNNIGQYPQSVIAAVFPEYADTLKKQNAAKGAYDALVGLQGYQADKQRRDQRNNLNDMLLKGGKGLEIAGTPIGGKSVMEKTLGEFKEWQAKGEAEVGRRLEANKEKAVENLKKQGYDNVEVVSSMSLMPSYGNTGLMLNSGVELKVLKLTDKDGNVTYADEGGNVFDTKDEALRSEREYAKVRWEQEHEKEVDEKRQADALEEVTQAKEQREQELRKGRNGLDTVGDIFDYTPGGALFWLLSGKGISDRLRMWTDTEWRELDTAQRARERAFIQKQKVTDDWGFLHTAWDTLLTRSTWDFGMSDVRDAYTTWKMSENANGKNLEELRRSERMLAEALSDEERTNQENESTWSQTFGYGAAYSIPLVLEFIATGGMAGVSVGAGKGLGEVGTRMAVRMGINEAMKNAPRFLSRAGAKLAAQRAAVWTVRHTGMAMDDLARAVVFANTTGALRTAGGALDYKAGNMQISEDGTVSFEGGKDWGDAIMQSEIDSVGEYFSELLGQSVIDPALNVIGRGLRRGSAAARRVATSGKGGAFGAVMRGYNRMGHSAAGEYLNGVYKKFMESTVGHKSKAILRGGRIDSMLGETLEEYENTAWTALFGDDEAKAQARAALQDPNEYAKTALATAATMGFLWLHTTAPVAGASYLHGRKLERQLDEASRMAKASINAANGAGTWEKLRERIDSATNDELQDVLESILNDDTLRLGDSQKLDVVAYATRLGEVRGFNVAAAQQGAEESDESAFATSRIALGYSAMTVEDAENALRSVEDEMSKHDVFKQDDVRNSLENDTINQLMFMRDNDAFTDEERELASAWYSAKLALEGAQARERDDAESVESEARQIVRQRSHEDGNVHPVVLKDGRNVWLLSGNSASGSKGDILYMDDSGKVAFGTWGDIAEEGEVMSGADYFGAVANEIQQQAAQVEADAKAQAEAEAKAQADAEASAKKPAYKLNKTIKLQVGDRVVEGTVVEEENADGLVTIETDVPVNGKRVSQFTPEELDKMAVPEAETPATQSQGTVPEGMVAGAPEDYVDGMELNILDDDGEVKPAMVMGRVRYENGEFVLDPNGAIVEYMMDDEVRHEHADKLSERVVGYMAAPGVEPEDVGETVSRPTVPEDRQGGDVIEPTVPVEGGDTVAAQETETGTMQGTEPVETQAPEAVQENGGKNVTEPVDDPWEQPFPRVKVKGGKERPDWYSVEPARAEYYIYEQSGLSEEDGDSIVKANLEEAQDAVKKLADKKPRKGIVDPEELKVERDRINAEQEAAAQKLAYWQEVAKGHLDKEEASVADNMDRASAKKLMASLGDYLDFEDFVMREIASGNYKFKWGDAANGTRGLASHTGFKDSRRERGRLMWLLSNKDGKYPEVVAEDLLSMYAAETGNRDVNDLNIDTSDALNVLLDVVGMGSRKDIAKAAVERHAEEEAAAARGFNSVEEMRAYDEQADKEHAKDERMNIPAAADAQRAKEEDMRREEGGDTTAALETEGTQGTTEEVTEPNGVDNQGNPINSDGSLYIEPVESIDGITDGDFEAPTRNVSLPNVPQIVRDAIGAGARPIIIKKNIFERNNIVHSDLTPEQSREILRAALYNPNIYGQSQKARKPYNWVVVNTTDEQGKNRLVLLEVSQNKDNVEIVHWHYIDERGLEKLRRQAEREDGQLLILPSVKEEVGALSDPTHGMPSEDKGTTVSSNTQEKSEKNADEAAEQEKLREELEGKMERQKAEARRVDDENFDRAVETQGEIPAGKRKAVKAESLAGEDATRHVFMGVYHDPKGYGVVTDAHILVSDKRLYDKKNKGKIIAVNALKPDKEGSGGHKKGDEISGKYPDVWRVIPERDTLNGVQVDFGALGDWLAGVETRMKDEWKRWREDNPDKKTSYKEWTKGATVQLRMPDGSVHRYDYGRLKKFAGIAEGLGADEMRYSDPSKAVLAYGKDGVAMLMPKFMEGARVENGRYEHFMGGGQMWSYDLSGEHKAAKPEDGAKEDAKASEASLPTPQTGQGEVRKSIGDVGEKIGGARKDLAQKLADRINPDGETFSKVFPKMDLVKLVEQGLDNKLAVSVMFLRHMAQDEAKRQSKGRLGSKQKGLGAAKFFAMYAKRVLETGDTNLDFKDLGWGFTDYGKDYIEQTRRLFEAFHEALGDEMFGLDLSGYSMRSVSHDNNSWYSRPNAKGEMEEYKPDFAIKSPRGVNYFTKEELGNQIAATVESLKKSVSYKKTHPYKLSTFYTRYKPNSYYIAAKIGGKWVPLTGEMSAKEVHLYHQEHEADLQVEAGRIAEQKKGEGRGPVWKPELSLGGGRARVGDDYREGRDISAEELMNTFGFRGVEFGNYVTQGERQKFINESYDAMMDLSTLLGVSPKALSLGGKLGFAIGARGGGKSVAHYEPDKNVINLTKARGAGALAHEWWHALDHYFNTTKRTATDVKNRQGFRDDVREEMRDAFMRLMDKVKESDYYKRSVALERRLRPNQYGEGYYDKPTELAARAFQDWVLRRLTEKGQVNDFLSAFTPEEMWNGKPEDYPYPVGDDAKSIGDAFDTLFGSIKEREGEGGMPILYQRGGVAAPEAAVTQQQRDYTARTIKRLRKAGVKVTKATQEEARRMAELADKTGAQFHRVYHGSGSLFDAFDHSHMGEGEGAQSYGWGTYVTEVNGIARGYAKTSARKNVEYIGPKTEGEFEKAHPGKNRRIMSIEIVSMLEDMTSFGYSFDEAKQRSHASAVANLKRVERDSNLFNESLVSKRMVIERIENMTDEEYANANFWDEANIAAYEKRKTDEYAWRRAAATRGNVFEGGNLSKEALLNDLRGQLKALEDIELPAYEAALRTAKDRLDFVKDIKEEYFDILEGGRYVYDVEVPDNDGTNYLPYDEPLSPSLSTKLAKSIRRSYEETQKERADIRAEIVAMRDPAQQKHGDNWFKSLSNDEERKFNDLIERQYSAQKREANLKSALDQIDRGDTFRYIQNQLEGAFGEKGASEFLRDCGFVGIEYPSNYRRGGNERGDKNYVIFNEGDAKIVGRVEFLRTDDGTVYGWHDKDGVHLTEEGFNPDTPAHEYTHGFMEMLRSTDPKKYGRVVAGLKESDVWQEVLGDEAYADISDDEVKVASEVAARLSGRENARRAQSEFVQGDIFSMANAIAIKERVKNALKTLWDTVAEWFGSKIGRAVPAERVARMTLRELSKGTNPDAVVEAEFAMGDNSETFKERQKRAVEQKGVVMPGLNDAEVKVVDVPKHSYTGTIKEATRQAIKAAKAKYVPSGKPKVLNYDNHGAEFRYSITGGSIDEGLSPKQQGKSDNKGVHLAMAEHLDEVIGNSIEVEEHPDRLKTNGERDNSNINPNALMHRFYGVVRVDGTDYRVMTLIREDNRPNEGNGVHTYEVTKIEVLDEETPNTSNGVGTPNSELEAYPLAKVIEKVGKTMEPGKNLLVESAKADKKAEFSISQGFGSAATSLNQVASAFRKIKWKPGTVNVDIGGGRFDKATDYLKEQGVESMVFDPFNRDSEHNRKVAERVRDEKVDTVTCNNVLNVIDSEQSRANVILQAAKALKEGGTAYFSVYEGDKSGVGRQTKADSWQNNRPTKDYVGEVEKYFDDVTVKNGVIIAKSPKQTSENSVWDFDGRYSGNDIRFREDEERPVFYSNAARAVEGVKQEKATGEQWLAMIKKAGGLKSGEDKWMGLTQWLDEHKGETLTKGQVLAFVRENGVKMEERKYIEAPYSFESLKREYDQWLHDEGFDYAQEQLLERFGDDADIAFDDLGGELVIANEEAAAALLGSEDIINSTRLDYTTEGLENKREIAFVVPSVEPYQESDDIHFGPENEGKAVMWVRFGETTDADGKRVLVIDEIQSNRHQDAREKGYKGVEQRRRIKELNKEIEQAQADFSKFSDFLFKKYGVSSNWTKTDRVREEWGWNYRLVPNEDVLTEEEVSKWNDGNSKLNALRDEKDKLIQQDMLAGGVPAAPFEKNWHEVAMKRMLRLAAEEGFDKVAWTTGEQQAERYNLGGVVDEVSVAEWNEPLANGKPKKEATVRIHYKNGDSTKLIVDKTTGIVTAFDDMSNAIGKPLSDVLGKELAQKILDNKHNYETWSGDNLRIGGEGMKGFYDQILPRFMDKYGKKWGVKTGEVELATPGKEVMHSVDVTDEMRRSVMQGQPLFRNGEEGGRPRTEEVADGRQRVDELSGKLGMEVTYVDDMSEQERAGLTERQRKAKGWYDPATGKIYINLDRHTRAEDMVATMLHEAVAHKGLRQMFGKDFDTFLDNVFDNVGEDVRRSIVELAGRKGWNFRVATEEYLAALAESTDFEGKRGLWQQVNGWFMNMLRKAGVKIWGSLRDDDLRYILWRSYNYAEERTGKLGPDVFTRAKDAVMRDELGIDETATETPHGETAEPLFREDDEDRRYSLGEFSERDVAVARDEYERMVSSGRYQFAEAVQDSMLGLKKLYQAILGKKTRIEDVDMSENAYVAENLMSSVNAAEQREYYVRFMKPLLVSISKLCGKNKKEREKLTDYMMAKHGLERNLVLAERDAREAEAAGSDYDDAYAACRERDYAGLTALTGETDVAAAEAAAQRMVAEYEADHDTSELWQRVKDATSATLDKLHRSGMLSDERYQQISDMFEHYIPLQGWDETTSEEVYGYLTSKNGPLMGSPIKRAAGRSSKADDPIATIGLMADTAIRQGNRNRMKQRFLNFALNHPSDLISVNDLWLQYDDASGEWVPVFADIDKGDSPEEVERKVDAFETRMRQLAQNEPNKYKHGKDAENIPYKVVGNNMREHQVLVKRGGRTYVLTINGNPRAAQALNGLTNPDVEVGGVNGAMLKDVASFNRTLSAFYTTRNPDFVVSNFIRDTLYSNCMTWVKESPTYALHFHKNFGKFNPAMMANLLIKWEQGKLDDSKKYDRLFKQFMLHGGETGYTSVKNIDGHKKEIAKELKRQASSGRKAMYALGEYFEMFNRSVENCARFAAFVTSMEAGRSVERSAYDAKEVSVNFNKKGSGSKMLGTKGQDRNILKLLFNPKSYLRAEDRAEMLGQLGSYIGGTGQLAYVFWNAGVQGMTNFGRAAKRHPLKALTGAASMFTLGVVMPMLAKAMTGGDDDDDKNAYYNLPEYIRRSNIVIHAGTKAEKPWITIPLPIEFRAIYGLGELAYGVISGNERYSNSELAFQVASQVSQILPLDVLEGGGGWRAFVPSAVKPFEEALTNTSWTGTPIYKDTPWNKNEPEWTKAYKNTNTYLVEGAKWFNEITGGDDYKKGFVDINPAQVEYMLSGMFGGAFSTIDKLVKMGETVYGDRDFEWRNMLLANRVLKTGDERLEARKLKSEYFKYMEEFNETGRLLKKYGEAKDAGVLKYAEKIDFLNHSPEYARYAIFGNYKPLFDAFDEAMKEAGGEERAELESKKTALVREMVNLMHESEDGGNPDSRAKSDVQLRLYMESPNMTVKKKVTDEIAARLGGSDSKDNSNATEYNKIYADKRVYFDLTEDSKLQNAKTQAYEAGDSTRGYAIGYAMKYILTETLSGKEIKDAELKATTRKNLGPYADFVQGLKNKKQRRERGLGGLGHDHDDEVMELYRELRKEIMEEFNVGR